MSVRCHGNERTKKFEKISLPQRALTAFSWYRTSRRSSEFRSAAFFVSRTSEETDVSVSSSILLQRPAGCASSATRFHFSVFIIKNRFLFEQPAELLLPLVMNP